MKYTVFNEVITKLQEVHNTSQKLYDLGIDLTNSIEDDYNQIITHILRAHYGEDGEDYISWWLYEDVKKVLYNDKGKIIKKLTTIKQLWEYVEELRSSKDFKEYELPKKMTDKEKTELIEEMFENKK